MDRIIQDILQQKRKIESIYLIGSHSNGTNNFDSDIDLVIFTKSWIEPSFFKSIRAVYPYLDLTILDKRNIEPEIKNPPSRYINSLNQILLHKRLLFGKDTAEGIFLSKKNVTINQLHFTLYSYFKILCMNSIYQNQANITLLPRSQFIQLNLHKSFKYERKIYYSYKELDTFILTICAYRLIRNNMFKDILPGKKWFIKRYMTKMKNDTYFSFISEYYNFISSNKTVVFDNPSEYLNGIKFKLKLYKILEEYINYLK